MLVCQQDVQINFELNVILELVGIHCKATRLEDIGYDAHLGQA
jgi:hypothetical protein